MLTFAVFSLFLGLSSAYGHGYGGYHSIDLPINSYHRGLKVIRAPSHVEHHETQVKIPPGVMPVRMTFLSKTSPVHVDQKHKSSKGSYKKSKSRDEPHKLVHEVVKPVYQEIKEIITPYRKVVQIIKPVKEERLTKVYKDDDDKDGDRRDGGDDNGDSNGGDRYNEYSNGYKKLQGVFANMDIDKEYLRNE